ncbi:MAG: CYTH domain-containing protein [Candidatus Pacebacteria bacterium]|nr:CYTH domain-containing protein [Candidatus Paceibacterota bacterium]
MQTEYEATFIDVDKEKIREKLKEAGAVLIKPERLMRRYTFNLPKGFEHKDKFLRVRDEGDKITMTFKIVPEGGAKNIDEQKEICFKVDDFDKAADFLREIGCCEKAYQETKRELWKIGDTEITIDQWPFLEPIVEVEGQSEAIVKEISEKLGFDYGKAKFCAVGTIYAEKYGVDENFINNHTPRIDFEMKNPFLE